MPTFTPTRTNTIGDIYQAIADLANNGGNGAPSLKSVDSAFQAFTRMPVAGGATLPFPFLFPMAPTFSLADRAMGSGSDKPLRYTVPILILVGESTNNFGPLMEQADLYILPFYTLYLANRSLEGTVQNILFNGPDMTGGTLTSVGVMGDITFNAVRCFGLEIPMHIQQRQPMTNRL